jgi:flagellar biosynthesis protein FlhG
VVVTTPDPTAIADAYALIKSVKATIPDTAVLKLVVNSSMNDMEANEVFERLNGVSSRFLGVKLLLLGCVPYDSYLVRAVRKQQPVSLLYPYSESATSYGDICAKLLELEAGRKNNIQNFVLKLIGRFSA